jgi:hypothetical protein
MSVLNTYFGAPGSYTTISMIDVINMTEASMLEQYFK